MSKLQYLIGFSLLMVLLFAYCSKDDSIVNLDKFTTIHTEVDEVGIQVCKSCHLDIYKSYIETGMGQSFGPAKKEISDASFGPHALVFDSINEFYYKPFFKDSVYYIREFRLEGSDTIHNRVEAISYIIGSGHHTNSHIINNNGYLTQAPITFYTQKGVWGMAPGFEEENLRFERILSSECITCHNHYPEIMDGALNKYDQVPSGIQCERCHGPGKLHVEKMLAGEHVDTSKYIDYSIVNPRHLPANLQMDVCQRCHLQGVAVLEEGKSFYDFRPGMELSEVMNVFLPRFSDSHENFIMASQADRLRMSKCYVNSNSMSCISCHNPHQSVQSTANNFYNNACLTCHTKESVDACSGDQTEIKAFDNNCVKCHMPPSHSIDIPHVSITDHYISKTNLFRKKKSPSLSNTKKSFLGLEHLTKENPTAIDMANGYLAMYDKFLPSKAMLDSAQYYLDLSKVSLAKNKALIHYYFNKQDYKKLISLIENNDFKDSDEWTLYRIGEAFLKLNQNEQAIIYLKKAVKKMPLNLDFQEKLGICFMRLEYFREAKTVFELVLNENQKRPLVLTNIGYLKVLENNFQEAEEFYLKAIHLDPDLEQTCLNLAALYLLKKDKTKAKIYLQKSLKINPNNEQAKYQIAQLK